MWSIVTWLLFPPVMGSSHISVSRTWLFLFSTFVFSLFKCHFCFLGTRFLLLEVKLFRTQLDAAQAKPTVFIYCDKAIKMCHAINAAPNSAKYLPEYSLHGDGTDSHINNRLLFPAWVEGDWPFGCCLWGAGLSLTICLLQLNSVTWGSASFMYQ